MSSDDSVVEIRVHGVHGGNPVEMLGTPFPEQVAGDDVARFLRRPLPPADGSVPPTDGSPVLEAFDWGRFTSGSPTRALWLLLAPFAILNLAGFTVLPGGVMAWPIRLVIRLLGLVLTVTLLLSVARVTMDVVLHQCAAAAGCRATNSWLSGFAGTGDGLRLLVGVLPPGLLIALLWWFGRQSFLYEPVGQPADREYDDDLGDRGFWHTGRWATPLRRAHVIAACAVLGTLCVLSLDTPHAGAVDVPALPRTLFLAVFALLVVAALAVVVVPARFVATATSVPAGGGALVFLSRLSLALLVAAVAYAVVPTWSAQPVERSPLPGFEDAARITIWAAATLLALVLVLVVIARLQYRTPDGLPRPFRPLWCGFAPAVLAALAVTLAGGFTGGLAFWVGNLLGHISTGAEAPGPGQWPIELGPSYAATSWMSGLIALGLLAVLPALAASVLRAGAVASWLLLSSGVAVGAAALGGLADATRLWLAAGAVAAAVVAVVAWFATWHREHLPDLVRRDYPAGVATDSLSPVTAADTVATIAANWRLARTKYRFHWVLGVAAALGGAGVAGTAVVLATAPSVVVDVGPPSLGPLVLSAVAAGFVTLGLRSWSNEKLRVTVGVLWDLLAFWPRSSHPLCPPPYGGRTVLELAHRAAGIAVDERTRAVVLSGHSQGSLICAAAVAVVDVEQEDGRHGGGEFLPAAMARAALPKLRLVTYGSQLQWAYARLFPRFIAYPTIERLHMRVLGGRWRNLFRWTDPLGGPVLAWPSSGTPAPSGDGRAPDPMWTRLGGPVRPVRPVPPGGVGFVVGHDTRLIDPVRVSTTPDTVRAPLLAHSDYFDDPAYAAVVRELTS